MNNTIININNKKVTFEQQGKQIFCTSLDIARVFEKRHTHILDIIKGFENDEDMRDFIGEPNFRLTYKDTQIRGFDKVSGKTRKDKIYLVSRDGFSFVAMGLTGKEARKWKIAFINAFNKMEQALLAQSQTIANQQVFNLSYKTHCRDIVLQRVKEMENEKNSQCVSINSYSVVETMKDDKIHTKIEVTAEFAPYPKGVLK